MQRIISFLLLGLCLAYFSTTDLLATPSTQAYNITFTTIKSDEFRVSFTKGNGTNRIVVIQEGANVTESPTNGTDYGASTIFNSAPVISSAAHVVYDGKSTNVRVTGLTPGTQYTAKVFEYDGSREYNLDDAATNPSSTWTLPGVPTSVAHDNATVTESSFQFSWTAPTGAVDSYNVTVATNSNFSSPVAGYNGVDNGNNLTATVTGLTPNTTYYYRVQSKLNGNNFSAWANGNVSGVTTKPIPPVFNPASDTVCLGNACAIVPNSPQGGTGINEFKFNVYDAASGGSPLNTYPAPVLYVTPTVPNLVTTYYVSTVSNKTGLESATRTPFAVLATLPADIADAGEDVNLCLPTPLYPFTLAAKAPSVGEGTWHAVSYPESLTGDDLTGFLEDLAGASYDSEITLPVDGVYELEWVVTSGSCAPTSDIVTISVYTPPTASITPIIPDQDLCGTLIATLDGNTPAGAAVGTWSYTPAGSGTLSFDDVNDPETGVEASEAGTYELTWTVENGICTPAVATITITFDETPTTADAGDDAGVCGAFAYTLDANAPTVGTGHWTKVSGPGIATATFDNASLYNSGVTVDSYGTYEFEWAISSPFGVCAPSTSTVTVTFSETPTVAAANLNEPYICGEKWVVLKATTLTVGEGTWSVVSAPTGATYSFFGSENEEEAYFESTNTTYGDYTLRWTVSDPNGVCDSTYDDVTFKFSEKVTPVSAGADRNVCGDETTFDASIPNVGQGTWTYVSGQNNNVTFGDVHSNVSSIKVLDFGAYTFKWTVTGECNNEEDYVSLTFYPDIASLGWTAGVDQTFCDGTLTAQLNGSNPDSVVFGDNVAGQWVQFVGPEPGIATFTSPSSYNTAVTFSQAGVYTLGWIGTSPGCYVPDTVIVNVYTAPTITFNNVNSNEFCSADNTDYPLTASPAGGEFTGAGVSVSGSDFNPFGLTPGTYTLTYTYTQNTCEYTATKEVTVTQTPTITWEDQDETSFCSDVDEVILTATTNVGDGVFTGPGVEESIFDPSSVGQGTYTITYTATNGDCEVTATKVFTVTTKPTISWSQTFTPVCVDAASIALTATSGSYPGYYSGPGISGSSTFDPAVAGAGTHTITFTSWNGQCTTYVDQHITVNPLPTVSAGTYGPVCEDSPDVTLVGSPAGGSFSGTGVSGNLFTPTTYGTYTITYTYTDGNSCTNSATTEIVVSEKPEITWTANYGPYCDTYGVLALDASTSAGTGLYTTNSPGLTGSDFNLTIAGAGTHTVTYTATNGACTSVEVRTIVINHEPVVTWTNTYASVCTDAQPFDIGHATNDANVTGVYFGAGVSGTTFDPAVAGPGSHIITYTATSASCTGIAFKTIVVNDTPVITWTPTTTQFCTTSGPVLLEGTATSGAVISYVGAGAYQDNNGDWYIDPSQLGEDSYYILMTASIGSCEATEGHSFEIYKQPVVDWANQQLGPYCNTDGSVVTLTATDNLGGIGTYSASGFSLDNGNQFTPSSIGVGNYTITYTVTNGVCTDYATKNFEVVNAPSVSWTTIYSPVCNSETTPIVFDADPGVGQGTYTINTAGEAGLVDNEFTPSEVAPGTYTITFTSVLGNCSDAVSKEIEVLLTPTISWSENTTTFCSTDEPYQLSGIATDADFTEYDGDGINGTAFYPNSVSAGTHTITYTASNYNGCSVFETKVFTVYEQPVVTWEQTFPTYCETDEVSVDLYASDNLEVGTYSGAGIDGSTFTPSLAGVGTHTITYTATNGICTDFVTQTIVVSEQPVISWTTSYGPYCTSDENGVSFDASNNLQLEGTYSASGNGLSGSHFTPSVAGAGTHTITYTVTNGGCSDFVTKTIEVYEQPVVTWSSTYGPYCNSVSIDVTLDAATNAGTGTYTISAGGETGLDAQNNTFNPSLVPQGTYTITYTATNEICSDFATKTIEVFAEPEITWTNNYGPYCTTDANGVTFDASNNLQLEGTYAASGNGLSGSHFTPSVAGAGTHTITYTVTNGACTNFVVKTIEVFEQPVVTWDQTFTTYCSTDEVGVELYASDNLNVGEYEGAGVSGSTFIPYIAGAGTHTITYTATNGICTDFATQTIVVSEQPVISWTTSYGPYCTTDANGVTFDASNNLQLEGTYSASGNGLSGSHFTPSVAGAGTHTITYTVTNGACTNYATTTIVVYQYIAANAGDNDNADAGEYEYTLAGNNPAPGTGTWALVSGPTGETATFANSHAYNTSVEVSNFGEYTFSWTVSNGACSSTDEVTIKFADVNAATHIAIVGAPTYTTSGESFTVTVATLSSSNVQVAADGNVNFTLEILSGDASLSTTVTGTIYPPATSTTVTVTANADDPEVGAIVEWQPVDDAANLTSIPSYLYVRATAPTEQASNLIFDTWSTNQVDLHWESNGNGAGVMLVAKLGATKVTYTNSAVGTYNSNTTYGVLANKIATNVYATYVGTDTLTTITGLSGRTKYAFKVIAYNGDGPLRSYNHADATNNNRSGMTLKSIFDNDDLPLVGDNILSASHITPNPARDYVMLTIDLAQSANLRVAFYSADGKQVLLPVDASNYNQGRHNFNIPVTGLAAGVYSVVISAGDEVIMDNVVIMP